MSEKQKYYITTAIAYTSGKPHLEIRMKLYWQMPLPAIKENRDMMFISRQEPMSMGRK